MERQKGREPGVCPPTPPHLLLSQTGSRAGEVGGEGSLHPQGLPQPPSPSASPAETRVRDECAPRACVFVRDSVCARLQVSACVCPRVHGRMVCILCVSLVPTCLRYVRVCKCCVCMGVRACACPCLGCPRVCVFVRAGNGRATTFTEALEVRRVKCSDPKPTAHLPPPSVPHTLSPPHSPTPPRRGATAKAEETVV